MKPLETVAVIGNGIIGHGIAQVFAMAGKRVKMIGRDEASLGRALDKISVSLADFARHGLIEGAIPDILARIAPSVRLEDAAEAQLVIEAVTEDLALKRGLFGRLDKICAPAVVLASSSGQPASALIDRGRASGARDRHALLVSAAADPAGRGVREPADRWSTSRCGCARCCAKPARSRR